MFTTWRELVQTSKSWCMRVNASTGSCKSGLLTTSGVDVGNGSTSVKCAGFKLLSPWPA